MKLYISDTSPYARMARIVVHEKGLGARVEEVQARTREAHSPYYEVNPSGRIPYLITDEGQGIEGSALVCRYLDELDGAPAFDWQGDWEARRLEEQARSLLDGLGVWVRELRRPEDERSPTILAHEAARADRLTAHWEAQAGHALLQGPLDMVQITLVCALEMDLRLDGFQWRERCPELARWLARITDRPSIAATRPPH